MKNNLVFVLAVIAALILIAVGPLILIWSLNTLFPALAIPYDIWTWLASVVLGTVLSPTVRITKK